MTRSNKIAEETDRRTVSIQEKDGEIWISMTVGEGVPETVFAGELVTGADATPVDFGPEDEFRPTPRGYKFSVATAFDRRKGLNQVRVHGGTLKLKATAEAQAQPDGPVDIYVYDDMVDTIEPGESTEIGFIGFVPMPIWLRPGIVPRPKVVDLLVFANPLTA